MAENNPFDQMSAERRREGSLQVLRALFPERFNLTAGANAPPEQPELALPGRVLLDLAAHSANDPRCDTRRR